MAHLEALLERLEAYFMLRETFKSTVFEPFASGSGRGSRIFRFSGGGAWGDITKHYYVLNLGKNRRKALRHKGFSRVVDERAVKDFALSSDSDRILDRG